MAIIQERPKRKNTGGRYIAYRKKRFHALGRDQIEVRIGAGKTQSVRGRGGNLKSRAITVKEVNVLDLKTKKFKKAEILSVSDNKANQHYIRRNTITKGAILETSAGPAKVTNRPGQEGYINAILLEK